MSVIQGFPQILQMILHHADRATLSVMIRLSTFTRDFTKPFLYPTKLVDPFVLPGTSHDLDGTQSGGEYPLMTRSIQA